MMAQFIKKSEKTASKSALHRMRVLMVLGLLTLHSEKFYEIGLLMLPMNGMAKSSEKSSGDSWLD